MKKTSKLNKILFSIFILISLLLPNLFFQKEVGAEINNTKVNAEFISASSEFLRDLDFETWQLVAYKSNSPEVELVLRLIGYPGSLRIDHPTKLRIESGRKVWYLNDITLLNSELANDSRQAAAEFDLDDLINNISKNRPLRLSLDGVFSELPVPPFLVKEWRSLG